MVWTWQTRQRAACRSAASCVVAGLDLGDAGAAAERRASEALRDRAARSRRSSGSARSGASRCRACVSRPRAIGGEVLVNRSRRALAVGDGLDEVARAEGDVAAGDTRQALTWRAWPDRFESCRRGVSATPSSGVRNDRSALLADREHAGVGFDASSSVVVVVLRARSGRSRRTRERTRRSSTAARRPLPMNRLRPAPGDETDPFPASPPRIPRAPAWCAAPAFRRSSRARRR